MSDPIIERCQATLQHLYRFSEVVLDLGDPITDSRLQDFETEIGYSLPKDFAYLLTQRNYISLGGQEVYGLGSEFEAMSLDQVYQFEHEAADNPMPKELLPFAADGLGNHYCLDLTQQKEGTCPVLFWQHDYHYKSKQDIEVCNPNFTDWVDEVLIGWTLEDTNYDGSPKEG